jgi:hypothetical protein
MTIDGVGLIKTYSDLYLIKQVETGVIYDEAIDVPGKYTYVETDELKTINAEEHELR